MEIEPLIRRIQSEFMEMPGLTLTLAQAARLWGLDRELCERVIAALVGRAFLRPTRAGTFARAEI